jgi:HSP20 family protein
MHLPLTQAPIQIAALNPEEEERRRDAMSDRIQQQRPAKEGQVRNDNMSLSRRDDSGNISYYRGGTYSPFELMRRFTEDVDRMFGSLGLGSFSSTLQPWAQARERGAGTNAMTTMAWTPAVDISTRGDDLMVSLDLPGIKPENVQIECEDNRLIVRGETRDERTQEEKDRGYWYSERSYGSFYRVIPLPQGINPDNAQAAFNNGVLEVTFPGAAKNVQPQRRRIEIQSGQGAQQAQSQSSQSPQKSESGQMSSPQGSDTTQAT